MESIYAIDKKVLSSALNGQEEGVVTFAEVCMEGEVGFKEKNKIIIRLHFLP